MRGADAAGQDHQHEQEAGTAREERPVAGQEVLRARHVERADAARPDSEPSPPMTTIENAVRLSSGRNAATPSPLWWWT